MSLSNYAELKVLDAICNNASFAVAQVYVKLHTGDPGEDGTSNAAGTTTRIAASFAAAASGACSSDADTLWTNVGTAETISHVSLWDASTAGNCLGSGALAATKTVAIGDDFKIASGNLTVTVD